MIKEHLKHAEIFYDKGCPYIKAVYEVETEHEVLETTFNKIEFPLQSDHMPIIEREFIGSSCYPNRYCNCIEVPDKLRLFNNDKGACIQKNIIKNKVCEMTLEEIEKELGYSVKIISKGETTNDKN